MFTLGADPEFFCFDGVNFKSAIGLIPGVKGAPEMIDCGAIHVDNVACEINTHPANCAESFSRAVLAPIEYVRDLLRAQDLLVSEESYAIFDQSQLESPEANEAGCDPDYNAYTGSYNLPPMLCDTPARSAAGHVHIGMEMSDEDAIKLVKALDFFVTLPMMKFENPDRRMLYGKAGCYRRKPYGVEYRTPSNHWVFSDERRQWMYMAVALCVEKFKTFQIPDGVEDCINTHNIPMAEELVKAAGIYQYPQNN